MKRENKKSSIGISDKVKKQKNHPSDSPIR